MSINKEWGKDLLEKSFTKESGESPNVGLMEIPDLNGCEVVFEENEIVAKPKKENGVAEILADTINSPKLVIRKEGKPLTGEEFRAWRKKLFEDQSFVNDKKYEKVYSALKQNSLSRTRMTQIESIIGLLADKPESGNWRARYKEIADGIDGPAYSAMSEEERVKMMEKLENLAVEIYNSI